MWIMHGRNIDYWALNMPKLKYMSTIDMLVNKKKVSGVYSIKAKKAAVYTSFYLGVCIYKYIWY